jgi:hypothetical protein
MCDVALSLRRWGNRQHSSQKNVPQSFGIAYAIEASNLDQLTAQRSLQCFIAFKVEGLTACFDRRPCSLKSPLQNLHVEGVQFMSR